MRRAKMTRAEALTRRQLLTRNPDGSTRLAWFGRDLFELMQWATAHAAELHQVKPPAPMPPRRRARSQFGLTTVNSTRAEQLGRSRPSRSWRLT